MAPRRRLALAALAAVVVVGVLLAVLLTRRPAPPSVAQADEGPVLLVPGYGGRVASLEPLARALRAAGREAVLVQTPGEGTGDLAAQAQRVDDAARAALAGGASSVDVVGYSAGGVVVRVWLDGVGSDVPVRRAVTLGSPHAGADIAGVAVTSAADQCPTACRQLAPGSDLLTGLPPTPGSPRWVSLYSATDEVVTPPSTSVLAGAVDVELQAVCPGASTAHGELPRTPLPVGLVDAALDGPVLRGPPGRGACDALRARGEELLSS